MIRMFKYRLVPNRKQRERLTVTLSKCRELWNIGLEQRRYRRIGQFEQMRQLTVLRKGFPEYQAVHVHVLQNVLKRLHRSFENMWDRGAGFPRFKAAERYSSFQFNNVGFKLAGRYLQLSKIGNIKVRLSREIPAGAVIKTLSIKRSVSGWYACLSCEVPASPLPASDTAVGVDVGLENFAALSDGTFIANPRLYQEAQGKLRRPQRRLSRCKRGSHRRKKVKVLLAKIHEHVRNQRMDFLHKESRKLVNKFGTIIVEDLNVGGLAKGRFAKQIQDAGWATWIRLLREKAAEAITRQVIAVNARGTSQTCPACGAVKKKALSERRHRCPCGYEAHRDTAAAQVIKARMGPSNAKIGAVSPCLV